MVRQANHGLFYLHTAMGKSSQKFAVYLEKVLYIHGSSYLTCHSLIGGGIMSGESNAGTLTIGGIVTNGIQIGLKNAASLVGAVVLWLLTIWIPYLNVGTTIAIYGIVVAMSKGHVVSPMEIFDGKYRKNMGEFFLLAAFLMFGVLAGYLFIVIPGIVIGIAWGQAIYLLIDKGLNPAEALAVSNRITYGKKWTIFLGTLALVVALMIVVGVLFWIFTKMSATLGLIIYLIGIVIMIAVSLGAAAYIYGELSKEV